MIRLRYERLRQGLFQDPLAVLSGVPQHVISQIEMGRLTRPTQSTLERLARALQVQPAEALLQEVQLPHSAGELAAFAEALGISMTPQEQEVTSS